MCMQKSYHKKLFILLIIVKQTIMNLSEGAVAYENKGIYKMKSDATRHQVAELLNLGHGLGLGSVSRVTNRTLDNSVTKSSTYKKWQVGRVSRKQYEIINMLWRKTKELKNLDRSTANFYSSDALLRTPSRTKSTSTTSSFIEFYYLDEDNNQKHQLYTNEKSQPHEKLDKIKRRTADYLSFSFRINNPSYTPLTLPHKQTRTNNILKQSIRTRSPLIYDLPKPVTLQTTNQRIAYKTTTQAHKIKNRVVSYFTSNDILKLFNNNETCPATETPDYQMNNKNSHAMMSRSPSAPPNLTTTYDRIRFFEIYDKGTPLPYYNEEEKPIDLDDVEKTIHSNKLRNDQGKNKTHKAKLAKKHITESNIKTNLRRSDGKLNTISVFNFTTRNKNMTGRSVTAAFSASTPVTQFTINKISMVAKWSDYSFMAAYIYEPSHVYCDAAGISPHWLVTSGSCLSRRHNNPRSEGRSAFIAYCGSSWWSPDRVAYVKYSVVHPRYYQQDKPRIYMYNIGLIQVETSMATCPGWAPVPLISHQFIGSSEGSKAHAIGWGLDRYDIRSTASDLPKYPLMEYESRVFSNSCPGISNHTESQYSNGEDGVQNLYCLLLPPYSGEKTDPIHGSMLVIGEKLCAIYLQEERRTHGDQSAHYTGTWHLGPWITYMAREPEDDEYL